MMQSAAKVFNPVTHVIFDMDGLLFDTESICEDVIGAICQSHGKEYTYDVKIKVMGTTDVNTASVCIEELSLPLTVPQFLTMFMKLAREEFKRVKLMKGAERLIRHLHKHNIQFCVATSGSQEQTELKISRHLDLFKLFSHFVMGSSDPEVKQGKPAPDIFLIAANRFKDKPDPSKCLVFEDSPNGVKAAVRAGMQVVMVPDEIVPAEKRTEATVVLKSLEHFQPELFGLPKFENQL